MIREQQTIFALLFFQGRKLCILLPLAFEKEIKNLGDEAGLMH